MGLTHKHIEFGKAGHFGQTERGAADRCLGGEPHNALFILIHRKGPAARLRPASTDAMDQGHFLADFVGYLML